MGVNENWNFISGLISHSKGISGGSSIWGATLGQLGGGDKSYIMAGIARMNGFKSTQGEDVATAIRWTQLLKNKQMVMPSDEILKQEFGKYVGQSVTGETANMTFAAFKSIYAQSAQPWWYQHKDNKDFNKDVLNTAAGLATGGAYDQAILKNVNGGSIKGWKVSKPYGMTDDAFESRLAAGYQVISRSTGISVSDLEGLRLRRSNITSKKMVSFNMIWLMSVVIHFKVKGVSAAD